MIRKIKVFLLHESFFINYFFINISEKKMWPSSNNASVPGVYNSGQWSFNPTVYQNIPYEQGKLSFFVSRLYSLRSILKKTYTFN